MSNAVEAQRSKLRSLMAEKDDIENQIQNLYQDLRQLGEKNNVQFEPNDPLVDENGFPRNDIDVAAARKLRQRVVYLQNDHSSMMNTIEKELHKLHGLAREEPSGDAAATSGDRTSAEGDVQSRTAAESNTHHTDEDITVPFAAVETVQERSPASSAGVMPGDKLLKFGSATCNSLAVADNGKFDITSLRHIVNNSIGRGVSILLERNGNRVSTTLVPGTSNGNPTVGMKMNPLTPTTG